MKEILTFGGKTMKRILSLILSAAMLAALAAFPSVLAADEVTFTLVPAAGTPASLNWGNTFTMELRVSNPAGSSIASINNLTVGFNSNALELTANPFELGDLTSGSAGGSGTLNFNAPAGPPMLTASSATFNFDSTEGNTATEGVLLKINFRVKNGAPSGRTDLTLAFGVSSLAGGLWDIMDAALVTILDDDDAFVTIAAVVHGDVNGDGFIGSNDVTMLRRYIAFVPDSMVTKAEEFKVISPSFNYANAHVRGEDDVSSADVTLLREYIASGGPLGNVVLGPQ
jgi:hypothetical protein